MKAKEVTSYIGANAKPILITVGVGLGVLAMYKIYQAFFGGQKTVIKQIVKGTNPTIDRATAKRYATRLYDAMKDTGTDTDEILRTLQEIKTADNFAVVYNEFGTPKYSITGSPLFGIGGSPLDLTGWFKEELDRKDKAYLLAQSYVEQLNSELAM